MTEVKHEAQGELEGLEDGRVVLGGVDLDDYYSPEKARARVEAMYERLRREQES